MGQNNCRCGAQQQKITTKKCQLYHENLLSEFELPHKQNFQVNYGMQASLTPECTKLPSKYTDLYLILKCTKNKFIDQYFYMKNANDNGKQWERICYKNKCKDKIEGQDKRQEERVRMSKFCRVMKFIEKNYRKLIQQIMPIYIQTLGFAVVKLWCNGNKLQIVVDDFVPVDRLQFQIDSWALILQKAMAKVLGDYKYLQNFSLDQIFTEVTGIPHFPAQYLTSTITNNVQPTFTSFREALKCDQILYETKVFSDQKCQLGYRNSYFLSHIAFEINKNLFTILKMVIPSKMNISVRIVQQMQKYSESLQSYNKYRQETEELEVEWFKDYEGYYERIGSNNRIGNCLYLNNVFTELLQGTYWILITHKTKSNYDLNFITYSQKPVKLMQNFTNNNLTDLLFNQLLPLKNASEKQTQKNIIKVIQFDKNFSLQFLNSTKTNRSYIKILSQSFSKWQQTQSERSKTLFLFVKDKKHMILVEGDQKYYRKIQTKYIKDKWVCIIGALKSENIVQLLQFVC